MYPGNADAYWFLHLARIEMAEKIWRGPSGSRRGLPGVRTVHHTKAHRGQSTRREPQWRTA